MPSRIRGSKFLDKVPQALKAFECQRVSAMAIKEYTHDLR